MTWDPAAHEAFRAAREGPFLDLLARVPPRAPSRPYRTIVDAGCGTGRTTRALARRYGPGARVTGVDSSAHMLAVALPAPRVAYVEADVATWRPAAPADLVVANAVLHWLPEPERMLLHAASWVALGGALAVQVPANVAAPSHRVVRETAASPQWAPHMGGIVPGDHVLALAEYARILTAAGFTVDAWDHTYKHDLPGDDAVLRWLAGTTLRPYLAALDTGRQREFLDDLRAPLAAAYPATEGVTRYAFRRRFVVARREA